MPRAQAPFAGDPYQNGGTDPGPVRIEEWDGRDSPLWFEAPDLEGSPPPPPAQPHAGRPGDGFCSGSSPSRYGAGPPPWRPRRPLGASELPKSKPEIPSGR